MYKQISIVIPCFNAADTINRTFQSLQSQTIGIDTLECIFVDDASTDNGATWEALLQIEREASDSVVVLQLPENRRQGGARNAGLQYVTGEYLMFLDVDDTLREDACKSLYETARRNNAEIIQFRHRFLRSDNSDIWMPQTNMDDSDTGFYDLNVPELRAAFLAHMVGTFGCTNKFYLTGLIKRTDSRFAECVVYEEPKFVYPLFLYADSAMIVNEAYYNYHWHAASTMTSELGKHLLDHPKVQLELLEDLRSRTDIYEKYEKEIEFHFILSFFCETIGFSVYNHGTIPLQVFQQMQRTCRKLFPERYQNEYLQHTEMCKGMLPLTDIEFVTQEELDSTIRQYVKRYWD